MHRQHVCWTRLLCSRASIPEEVLSENVSTVPKLQAHQWRHTALQLMLQQIVPMMRNCIFTLDAWWWKWSGIEGNSRHLFNRIFLWNCMSHCCHEDSHAFEFWNWSSSDKAPVESYHVGSLWAKSTMVISQFLYATRRTRFGHRRWKEICTFWAKRKKNWFWNGSWTRVCLGALWCTVWDSEWARDINISKPNHGPPPFRL